MELICINRCSNGGRWYQRPSVQRVDRLLKQADEALCHETGWHRAMRRVKETIGWMLGLHTGSIYNVRDQLARLTPVGTVLSSREMQAFIRTVQALTPEIESEKETGQVVKELINRRGGDWRVLHHEIDAQYGIGFWDRHGRTVAGVMVLVGGMCAVYAVLAHRMFVSKSLEEVCTGHVVQECTGNEGAIVSAKSLVQMVISGLGVVGAFYGLGGWVKGRLRREQEKREQQALDDLFRNASPLHNGSRIGPHTPPPSTLGKRLKEQALRRILQRAHQEQCSPEVRVIQIKRECIRDENWKLATLQSWVRELEPMQCATARELKRAIKGYLDWVTEVNRWDVNTRQLGNQQDPETTRALEQAGKECAMARCGLEALCRRTRNPELLA